MDELVSLVTQKAGISQDQAQKAVTTVMGFLKERLPGPLAGQLDRFTGGGGEETGGAGGMAREAEEAMGRFGR